MEAPRRILVPVDLSEPSRAALDYANGLARAFDASIDVLHVAEVPSFVPLANLPEVRGDDLSLVELVRSQAEQALSTFLDEAAGRGINVRHPRVELGTPAQVIVQHAKTFQHDLIVIGTHGRTGLSHALIGSVAERVIRHAPCPVLSVRRHDR